MFGLYPAAERLTSSTKSAVVLFDFTFAGWPYFRRRRLRGGRGVNNNQRTNPSGSVRDHLRRGDMAPVPSSSSARCSSPKQPEGKSFRYLYQARRTHGDVICQV